MVKIIRIGTTGQLETEAETMETLIRAMLFSLELASKLWILTFRQGAFLLLLLMEQTITSLSQRTGAIKLLSQTSRTLRRIFRRR